MQIIRSSILLAAVASAKQVVVKFKEPEKAEQTLDILKERFPHTAFQPLRRIGLSFAAAVAETEDDLQDDGIEYVVDDNEDIQLMAPTPNPQEAPTDAAMGADLAWHLDRIDQRSLPLDGTYSPGLGNGGEGVTVFIVDTGVDATHPEFEGRVTWGYDGGNGNVDENGHGTQEAGVIGSRTFGVAPKANMVAVNVCPAANCELDFILAGLAWVAETAQAMSTPKVASLTLNGLASDPTMRPVEEALISAIAEGGLQFFVSSGNAGGDACDLSPARVSESVTVNNSNINDERSRSSNWGDCSDLYAPGDKLPTTDLGGGTTVVSGTSFSAPVAAAGAALILGEYPELNPQELKKKVLELATKEVISDARGPDSLLYVGAL